MSSEEKIEMNLIRGEAFIRIAVDPETSNAKFTCGIYPSDYGTDEETSKSGELSHDTMLGVLMAGIVSMLQDDMDDLLHAGMQYLIEGNAPFDFIVSAEEAQYYENLTEAQKELMRMIPEGEA